MCGGGGNGGRERRKSNVKVCGRRQHKISSLSPFWQPAEHKSGLSNRTRLASANTLAPLLPLCPRRHCLFRPRSTPHSRPGQLGWLGPTYSQLDVAGFQRWNEKLSMLSMPHTFWRLPACVCFKASLLLCNLIPWLKSYTLGTISLFFCWLSVGNETCWPLYLFSLQLFVEHSFSMMSDDL